MLHCNFKLFQTTIAELYKFNDSRLQLRMNGQRRDESRGFVEADNSGRSNIFSIGEKALYSYSPTVEDVARRGLGGGQGLAITIAVIVLVGLATVGVTTREESIYLWSNASSELDPLTQIVSSINEL